MKTLDHAADFVYFAAYPGRVVIAGLDETGKYLVQACAMTARSEPNRNRVYLQEQYGTVRTEVADPFKPSGDPEFTIYNVMQEVDLCFIASNGKHTDMLADGARRHNMPGACVELKFENDEPNYTPRIAVVCLLKPLVMTFWRASKLQWASPDTQALIQPYTYSRAAGQMNPGIGHCLPAYAGDGNPLPTYRGQPYPMPLRGSMEVLADELWDALNKEHRVGLVVKFIEIKNGKSSVTIRNQY